MKELKKILFHGLSPALAAALAEHLGAFEVTRDAGAGPFDLVIGAGAGFPGCPVLDVEGGGGPLRLGVLLREIGRRLAEPVLYLSDIPLGRWTFRPQARALEEKDGTQVDLTDRETDMLAFLARHGGRAVSREALLRHVWRYQDGVDTHTLETHLHRLRRKTGQDIVETGEGGYRLCTDAGKG